MKEKHNDEYLPSSTRVHWLVSGAGTDCARLGSSEYCVHAGGGDVTVMAVVVVVVVASVGAGVCCLGLDSAGTVLLPLSFRV